MAKLNFIQSSKVRRFMKEKGMRVSGRYLEALDREVAEIMGKHQKIAQADRCKTVLPVHIDLPGVIKNLSRDLHR